MLINLLGIVVLLAIAIALSSRRRHIRPRIVITAFVLQAAMALFVLRTPWGIAVIDGMARGVTMLFGYAQQGTSFVFGSLAQPEIGGTSFALTVLTVIVFFSSLVAVLEHLGVMSAIIRWIGGAVRKVTGVTRVESLATSANIFIGQSESALAIKPYLARMTPPQLFVVMVSGMTSVAGGTLAAYAAMVGSEILPYLLAAAFMSAPASLLMAKLMMPDDPAEAAEPAAAQDEPSEPQERGNIITAAADGAQTGLKIAVSVGAMLIAFISLIALANDLLGWAGSLVGMADLTFQRILGILFAPVMFVLGISWEEAQLAGALFGEKLVFNEFVAFLSLSQQSGEFSPRSLAVLTFALCGFANFSSIAIQVATFGSLAPGQRGVVARLGLRALLASSLANLMSAALAGLVLSTYTTG